MGKGHKQYTYLFNPSTVLGQKEFVRILRVDMAVFVSLVILCCFQFCV